MKRVAPRLSVWMELPLTLGEASRVTGYPESTLRDRMKSGSLEGRRDGKLYVTTTEALIRWYSALPDAKRETEAEKAPKPRGHARSASKRGNPVSGGTTERFPDLRLGQD